MAFGWHFEWQLGATSEACTRRRIDSPWVEEIRLPADRDRSPPSPAQTALPRNFSGEGKLRPFRRRRFRRNFLNARMTLPSFLPSPLACLENEVYLSISPVRSRFPAFRFHHRLTDSRADLSHLHYVKCFRRSNSSEPSEFVSMLIYDCGLVCSSCIFQFPRGRATLSAILLALLSLSSFPPSPDRKLVSVNLVSFPVRRLPLSLPSFPRPTPCMLP